MKIQTSALILAGAVIISVIITATTFHLFPPYDVKELGMYLQVSDYTGFNVETSAVIFGTIPPGGTGKRDITVSNLAATPKQVVIKTEGELAEWVSVEENRFLIQVNESKTINVFVYVPENAEFGNYTGTLKMLFYPA